MNKLIIEQIENAIKEKRVIVFSGFTKLGYADVSGVKARIEEILKKEAQFAGGLEKLLVVSGATDEGGIGDYLYSIARRLGIQTLGIVSGEFRATMSPNCQSVIYIDDTSARNDASYRMRAAKGNGVLYVLGGDQTAFAELEKAKTQDIATHTYAYAPDPDALARVKADFLKKGQQVASYTPVNDLVEARQTQLSSIMTTALAEHLRAAYKVHIPHLNTDAHKEIPVLHEGKHYIQIGTDEYPVHFDVGNAVWRIYSKDNPAKPTLPVHYQNGQWQLYSHAGMAGGAQDNLPEPLRVIYKASLPAMSDEVSRTAKLEYEGNYYARIGEDYYLIKPTQNDGWAISSPGHPAAKPLAVLYENDHWQLALRKVDIDGSINFSEHRYFRKWFHTAINVIATLAARNEAGATKPALSPLQKQNLMRLILKSFHFQATHVFKDIRQLDRNTSPLTTTGSYSRESQTRLWDLSRSFKEWQLQQSFHLVQQNAARNRATTADPQGPAFIPEPVDERFSLYPSFGGFAYKGRIPEICDTVPLDLNQKDMVYIIPLRAQLIKSQDVGWKEPDQEGVHDFLGLRGLRMSPNQAVEDLAVNLCQMIDLGKTEMVRSLLTKAFYNKHRELAEGFARVELSPNGLIVAPGTDPLTETGPEALNRLHDLYQECLVFDKSRLPFYIRQNLEILQHLVGSDARAFFTEKTPAMVSAILTDELQTTHDLMKSYVRDGQDSLLPARASVHMERFYETMQSLHHLLRFQISWNGTGISAPVTLENTLKQQLPADMHGFSQVVTGPHGMSVLNQLCLAQPGDFHKESAFLYGTYFETPELLPHAVQAQSVYDYGLKMKKLIVMEPHPNNASLSNIVPHSPVALINTVFGGSPSSVTQRTILMDVTSNHLTEPQIQNLLAAARPYIERGMLNLILFQSGTKLFQNGMDIVSLGTAVILNNNDDFWRPINEAINKTKWFIPSDDKAYIARMLAPENMPHMQDYLNKIRANTRLLYDKLERALPFGHRKQNAFELCLNTDTETVYVALRPTDRFNAAQQMARLAVNDMLYPKYFVPAFQGLMNVERQSFGFNVTSFSQCTESIRLTLGIEDEALLDEYVSRIVKLGKELYQKGYIADLFDDIDDSKAATSLGGETIAPARWKAPALAELSEKINSAPVTQEQTGNKNQIIIQMQGDETTHAAAEHLLLKNPRRSKWIQWLPEQPEDRMHSVYWDPQSQSVQSRPLGILNEDSLRIVLVGHTHISGGETFFGGRSLEALQQALSPVLSKISPSQVKHLSFDLVGCRLFDPAQPLENSFSGKLAHWLIEQNALAGIQKENISVSVREYPVRVNEAGKKEILTKEGWFSKEILQLYRIPHKKVIVWDPVTQKMAVRGPALEELFDARTTINEALQQADRVGVPSQRRESLATLRKTLGKRISESLREQSSPLATERSLPETMALSHALIPLSHSWEQAVREVQQRIPVGDDVPLLDTQLNQQGETEIGFVNRITGKKRYLSVDPRYAAVVKKFSQKVSAFIKICSPHVHPGAPGIHPYPQLNINHTSGVNTLNAAFLLQTLIDMGTNKNDGPLSLAVKIKLYAQLTQNSVGLAGDGFQLAQLVQSAMKREFKLVSTVGLRVGHALPLLGTILDIINIATLSVQLSQSTDPVEQAVLKTNLATSGIGALWGGTATALQLVGATSLSTPMGYLMVPFIGLSLGASALASAYAATREEFKACVKHFDSILASVEDPGFALQKGTAKIKEGAIVDQIDFEKKTIRYNGLRVTSIHGGAWHNTIGGIDHYFSRPDVSWGTENMLDVYAALFGHPDKKQQTFDVDKAQTFILPGDVHRSLYLDYTQTPFCRTTQARGLQKLREYYGGKFVWLLNATGFADWGLYIVKEKQHNTQVVVRLDSQNRTLICPHIQDDTLRGHLSYFMEGKGGQYQIVLPVNPIKIDIKAQPGSVSESWLFNISALSRTHTFANDHIQPGALKPDFFRTIQITAQSLLVGGQTVTFDGQAPKTILLTQALKEGVSLFIHVDLAQQRKNVSVVAYSSVTQTLLETIATYFSEEDAKSLVPEGFLSLQGNLNNKDRLQSGIFDVNQGEALFVTLPDNHGRVLLGCWQQNRLSQFSLYATKAVIQRDTSGQLAVSGEFSQHTDTGQFVARVLKGELSMQATWIRGNNGYAYNSTSGTLHVVSGEQSTGIHILEQDVARLPDSTLILITPSASVRDIYFEKRILQKHRISIVTELITTSLTIHLDNSHSELSWQHDGTDLILVSQGQLQLKLIHGLDPSETTSRLDKITLLPGTERLCVSDVFSQYAPAARPAEQSSSQKTALCRPVHNNLFFKAEADGSPLSPYPYDEITVQTNADEQNHWLEQAGSLIHSFVPSTEGLSAGTNQLPAVYTQQRLYAGRSENLIL